MPIPSLLFLIATYVVACAVVGLIGRNKTMGAWGYFFGSILLTPVVGLLLVAVSASSRNSS